MDLYARVSLPGRHTSLRTVITAAVLLPWAASAAAQEDPIRVDVGGYGSFRYEANGNDDVPSSMTMRRFVVTTDARWGWRLQVYSEVEYERLSEIEIERSVGAGAGGLEFEQEIEGTSGSEIAVEQAWAQFNLTPSFGIRFGAVLPPVGRFNIHHDDNVWNFPRRPLVDRAAAVLPAKAAWTEVGLGLVGQSDVGEQGVLSYQAYFLNGVTLDFGLEEKVQTRDPKRNKLLLEAEVSPTSGSFDGSQAADAFAARVALSPGLGHEIALSAYVGDYTPAFLDEDATLSTLAVDGRTRLGRIVAEGEFLYTRYSNLGGVLTDFARVALDHETETTPSETATLESEVEVKLKGLSDERYGFWLDLSLPVALDREVLGLENAVLAPVARYERVWYAGNLESFDFSGGRVTGLDTADRVQERLSLGLAFRPVPQAVFHLVWERNHSVTGGLIDPGVDSRTTNGVVLGMAVGF